MTVADELDILQVNFNEGIKNIIQNLPPDSKKIELQLVGLGSSVSILIDLEKNVLTSDKTKNELLLDAIKKVLERTD